MPGEKYVFQMSGLKDLQLKADVLQSIRQLQGQYLGGSFYKKAVTHLIVTKPVASEKFLAACAAGKWIITPQYVLDSAKHNAWLPEALYEFDVLNYVSAPTTVNPVKKWREKIACGQTSGAFQGWVVYLVIADANRRDLFKSILEAGQAVVYTDGSVPQGITHVLTTNGSGPIQNHTAPVYNVSFIAEHLFESLCSSLNWSIQLDQSHQQRNPAEHESFMSADVTTEDESMDVTDDSLHCTLEEKLNNYLLTMELQKRNLQQVPEDSSVHTLSSPTQVVQVDFSNALSLVECGLFLQAAEELLCVLKPKVLPAEPVLHALMRHALHGEAETYFLSMFNTILNNILINNPTSNSPTSVKYFLKILQCPKCENKPWLFLKTSVRFCLGSTDTCHLLPSSASTELLHFHINLQAFILRIFQLELHAANSGKRFPSVLSNMFWTSWEKTTLTSSFIKELVQLLVETIVWASHTSQVWKLRVLATLQDILAVVVEFWAQMHTTLNRHLVQTGFEQLAEHIAMICQDVHSDYLRELVPGLLSHRLRLYTADAIFRKICCRNRLLINPGPVSLHKIVSSYLKALGQLCGRTDSSVPSREAESNFSSADSRLSDVEERKYTSVAGSKKDPPPKGYKRINAVGETLLHRACKRNQVETVLQILNLPDVDANVRDHAGWTPLHEACNHGSEECVRALLKHCPGLHLDTQVDGVSPLHDALTNQHTHIAKMLLRHAGSALLQVCDSSGRTPLDLVSSPALCEELRQCAEEGDAAFEVQTSDVRDVVLIDACSCLLNCLLLTYLLEKHIPVYESTGPVLRISPAEVEELLSANPETLKSQWKDSAVIKLAADLKTLMKMDHSMLQLKPALISCNGIHTTLLIQLLKDLQAEGTALRTGDAQLLLNKDISP